MVGVAPLGQASASVSVDTTTASPTAVAVPATLLLQPASTTVAGGDSVELAILWVQALQQDRAAGRQRSAAAESRIEAANARELSALREQARAEHRAANWQCACDLIGAGTGVVDALIKKPAEGERDVGAGVAGGGKIVSGAGGLLVATAKNRAGDAAAAATAAKQQADAAERSYTDGNQEKSDAGDSVTRVLDLLRDLLGAQRATESSAVVRG